MTECSACLWLSLLGALLIAILGLAWWLGFFYKMEITESIFPGGTFVYLDWRGSIRDLKDPFH